MKVQYNEKKYTLTLDEKEFKKLKELVDENCHDHRDLFQEVNKCWQQVSLLRKL